MTEENKLVGFELVKKELDIVNGELVGEAEGKHVGKLGWLSVSIKGGFSAIPVIHKGIDWLEKKIPGDQTAWAGILKDAVSKIKV